MGEGTIRIHSRTPERYRCRVCKSTFSARRGTMLEGLRKPTDGQRTQKASCERFETT